MDFTTVGVKVPSLSSQASLLPKSLSPKKPRDMRERAILNHAYSNPQCHQSIGKLSQPCFIYALDMHFIYLSQSNKKKFETFITIIFPLLVTQNNSEKIIIKVHILKPFFCV